MSDPINIDGINSVGPIRTGYRDFFPDMPAFGTEYDADRMSTVFDPSGSFQSDRDIVNMLAAAYPNESAEKIADRLQSLTANTAMARQFGGAAPDPYSQLTTAPPVTPPATGGKDILDVLKGLPGAAVDAAKSAADTLLNQIKEILPFYDQAQIVLNPRTGTGNIVLGTPPAGQPVIQAGQLPRSNTNVGVTTGIPILDQAINSVLGRKGGLESGSIRDEVIKIISEQTGASPAATAGILGEDLDTILSTANVKAAEAATRLGVDLIGGEKEVVGDGGTGVVRNGGTGATLGGGKIITGAADSPIVTGAADSPAIVTGAADSPIVTGAADAVDIVTGSLTPADLGEDTTVKTGGGDSSIVTGGGGGGSPATPATPLYGQGIRSMKTEKAGVTPLEDVFDIGDMSLANVLRLLAGEDDNTQGTPYYGGGSVNKNSSVDELIRLLRG